MKVIELRKLAMERKIPGWSAKRKKADSIKLNRENPVLTVERPIPAPRTKKKPDQFLPPELL